MHPVQNYWVLNIGGRAYHLSPYLIFNGIGLICALFLLDSKLKKHLKDAHNRAYVILVLSIPAGWIGAHLMDALIKGTTLINAGFTFYGGLISGLAFFGVVFLRVGNRSYLFSAINAGVMPLVIGHAVGRMGCYFSGCCYGKVISSSHFLYPLFRRHPTQLYEALFLFLLFEFMFIKGKLGISFSDLNLYLVSYGAFRFIIEFLRDDYRGKYLLGLSPSQWISLLMIMSVLSILYIKGLKTRLPQQQTH